jgi:hypothetical protein
MILLISASGVAKITGVSHWHLATLLLLNGIFSTGILFRQISYCFVLFIICLFTYIFVVLGVKLFVNDMGDRGWGQRGEMTQALYAHMNNKTIKK